MLCVIGFLCYKKSHTEQVNATEIAFYQDVNDELVKQYHKQELSKITTEATTEDTTTGGDYRSLPRYTGEIDCELVIPSISLDRVVVAGGDLDYNLNRYLLTAGSVDMRYDQGGRYIILGHMSANYGHSLNRLHEVKPGDSLYIRKNDGVCDTYVVQTVETRPQEEIAEYTQQTGERLVTVVTCDSAGYTSNYIVVTATVQ